MPADLAYQAYQIFLGSIDWLYPPECGGCGKRGVAWCNDCLLKTHVIQGHCCEVCGDVSVKAGVCQQCKTSKPTCKYVRSWAVYDGPARNAVHKLKYKGDFSLGARLAAPMIGELNQLNWPIDLVVPVPLSLARLAERGYNQAALLARFIAHGIQGKYSPKALQKTRDTRSQVGLSISARQTNVADAFLALEPLVSGKRILIVDDVTTSGSTLNECAKALRNVGAGEVYGYTFARAAYTNDVLDPDVITNTI